MKRVFAGHMESKASRSPRISIAVLMLLLAFAAALAPANAQAWAADARPLQSQAGDIAG